MKWEHIGFDWNRARAFLVTAEEGSFSAAAQSLGVMQSTLSRQVNSLEQELKVQLFERHGRGVQLTQHGLELLESVREMAECAGKFSRLAAGQSSELTGLVSISVSELNAVMVLPEIIRSFHEVHPKIQIEIIASNEVSDLKRREADIAIRNCRPTHPDLFARRLDDSFASLYASSTYIESLGGIETKNLNKANYIGFSQNSRLIQTLNSLGLEINESNFNLFSTSQLTQWEFIKAGMGIGIMMDQIASRNSHIMKLSQLPSISIENWLVSHQELKTNPRIRLVFDYLCQSFTKFSGL